MTPEQLKSSILQYAIQGKLTDQRPSDDNVSELIKHLKECKAELVKKKIIKKEKALPDFADEEVPFDIPDSWEWCYCQDIFFAHSAMRIHQSDWKSEGVPFFRGRELVRLAKYGDPDAEVFITEEFYNELKEKGGVPQKDDILITAVGTLGKVYVVKGTNPFYYKDAYILCLDNYGIDPYYIKYLVESPYCQNYVYGDDAYGTTVAQLTLEKLKKMLIPVPSLEEQHRIVAKIEELLPYVDRYAEAYEKLGQFNAKFPEEMKKSILQYAIQGKLVEQRPEEGTAEELYQQIQADKRTRLGSKRETKLSSETFKEDEIPYDIPDTWKWVRFGHIMINRDAERIPLSVSEREKLQKTYDYYGASGVIDKVDKYIFDDKLLLIGEDGANLLSRSTPIAFLAEGKYWVNNHAHVLDCNKELLYMEYIMYYINAITLAPYVTGTAQPKMNQEKMNSIPIALPPYEEQKRIVAKIKELLPYCNQLSKCQEK